jgi:hypothetical protein
MGNSLDEKGKREGSSLPVVCSDSVIEASTLDLAPQRSNGRLAWDATVGTVAASSNGVERWERS